MSNLTAALDEARPTTPPRPTPSSDTAFTARQQLSDVLVADLHPDPNNPREDVGDVTELAKSMASAGLLQPIIARRHGDQLIVVAGHRRLAAAQMLKWHRVSAVIRRDMAPDRVLAAMLIENGQRAGLDPVEEARALKRLAGDHATRTHAELAQLIGRTQVHVSARLALLELSVEEQEALRAGQLNLGDAVRRARVASGRVRPAGSTGSPHLGVDHDLATKAGARCRHLKHKSKGRNSVGGVACGACWESVIRADERTHLHDQSNKRGRCVLCDTERAS